MRKWLSDIVAMLLGVTLTFAFAPFEVFPLAIVATSGLLALWLRTTPQQAFRLGFLFGLGLFGSGVYWIYISIHLFGDIPNYLAAFFTACVVGILAVYPALVGYAANRYFPDNSTSKIICIYPAFWVFSEWVRSWLFSGFPWLLLGYSQTNSPLRGYAPILSVYGVSLAVIITSALLVNAARKLNQKDYRTTYTNLFAAVGLWIAASLLVLIPWTKPTGNPLSVSLVQGNIPQTIKWVPEYLKLSFDRYLELTTPLWGKDKLIIWPESAIPLPLQQASTFVDMLDGKARATGSHLIMGIPVKTADGDGYLNSVLLLGKQKSWYNKRFLVPFGEYIPMAQYLSFIFKQLNVPVPEMVPGKINQPLMTIGKIKIMPSVCYEIAFPELVRSRDPNLSMLLTVTNDAWFGKSSAQAQHLQIAKMRGIEMGRPVLFVSNDGISAILSPDGKVDAAAPDHETFVLNGTVQATSGLTPWMTNGIDPLLFILLSMYITATLKKNRTTKALRAKTMNSTFKA